MFTVHFVQPSIDQLEFYDFVDNIKSKQNAIDFALALHRCGNLEVMAYYYNSDNVRVVVMAFPEIEPETLNPYYK